MLRQLTLKFSIRSRAEALSLERRLQTFLCTDSSSNVSKFLMSSEGLTTRQRDSLVCWDTSNACSHDGTSTGRFRFVSCTFEEFAETVKNYTLYHSSADIPSGCCGATAAMHAACSTNRYNVHATLKTTPFQSLWGRPYEGKITETVFGLDPKATNFKPAWRRDAWFGKDVPSDMHLISTDGQTIIRTKAIRKIASKRSPELLLGMIEGPMDFFGHRQTQSSSSSSSSRS